MNTIYVNLKRFDIPRVLGGVCPEGDPTAWIDTVLTSLVSIPLPESLSVVLFVPESLLPRSLEVLGRRKIRGWSVGCQGVHREDVAQGGNFGAFTSLRPAKAMRALGCAWALIGHSEERKEKLGVLSVFEPKIATDPSLMEKARRAVSSLIGKELEAALTSGMNALLCVGESAEERGDGNDDAAMKGRVTAVLREQLRAAFGGLSKDSFLGRVSIAYEPVWAIGPGKTPPGADYINFAARTIQDVFRSEYGIDLPVVYGGGLKEANAAAISAVPSLSGGLVALTRFEGPLGFYPEDFKRILENSVWYSQESEIPR